MTKNYISTTTCASSRMIHLEILPDETTAAYLRSQRRLIARRGIAKSIVSDNGKTFKGRALKEFNARNGDIIFPEHHGGEDYLSASSDPLRGA